MKLTRILILTLALAMPVALTGCASYTIAPITISEEGRLIDTRSSEAFNKSRISGAVNIDFESPNVEQTLSGLRRSNQYVLYGDSGEALEKAFNVMMSNGFVDITVAGSLEATSRATGLPIE